MKRHPLYAKMRNLRQTARRIQPDADWVLSTRQTLRMQAEHSFQARTPQAIETRKRAFLQTFVSFTWLRQPAIATLAIVIAVFGSGLFSVSAAEQSLPGDFLYSVKLASEQARLALVSDPTARVKMKTTFTGKRVDEMKKVVQTETPDRKERVTKAAEVLKRDLNTIKEQLNEVQKTGAPNDVKEAVKLVDDRAGTVIDELEFSKRSMSPEERVKITEVQVAAADASVKAIEVLVDTHATAGDVVTGEDVATAVKMHTEKMGQAVDKIVATQAPVTVSSTVMTTTTTATASTTEAIKDGTVQKTSSTENGVLATEPVAEKTVLNKMTQAQQVLDEADQLMTENRIGEAVQKLKEGIQQVMAVQQQLEAEDVQDEKDARNLLDVEAQKATNEAGTTLPEAVTSSTNSGSTTQSTLEKNVQMTSQTVTVPINKETVNNNQSKTEQANP